MDCPTFSPLTVEKKATERMIVSADKVTLITLSIEYPQFRNDTRSSAAQRINRYYLRSTGKLVRYCETKLRRQAEDELAYSLANGFPFRPFEVKSVYSLTYNDGCWLSLCVDVYQFTGGAHGNTVRFGDIWQSRFGVPVSASEFFPCNADCRSILISSAVETATRQLADGSAVYFDDYRSLIKKNFSCGNTYMTETGLALFYQQYEISPYVEGIPVFIAPYSDKGPFILCCAG
jgi:hypothetical protein